VLAGYRTRGSDVALHLGIWGLRRNRGGERNRECQNASICAHGVALIKTGG
jgi:hypothetical protein